MRTVSAETARAVDKAALEEYGQPEAALVEAAGGACASVLKQGFGTEIARADAGRPILVCCGAGNNAADGLCLLRRLILDGSLSVPGGAVLLRSSEDLQKAEAPGPLSPYASNLKALRRMGVRIRIWAEDAESAEADLASAVLVLDALAGTGLAGPLRGPAAEMAAAVNRCARGPVVAVDVPSGIGDSVPVGVPCVNALATLAIKPIKSCLFLPQARALAGEILFVGGVFPESQLEAAPGPALLGFAEAAARIPRVSPDAYKHKRGVLEIYAGARGSSGAARLAAAGASSSGVGLCTLAVDEELWPVLASAVGGTMVKIWPEAGDRDKEISGRSPDALLAGPGWGLGSARASALARFLEAEKAGTALVLDADALRLAADADAVFSGRTVLTPHLQEFSRYIGVPKERISEQPDVFLLNAARERNAVVILKGHTMRIAAPDGRLVLVDGMEPALAAGGSGDVLAGLCAGLCARERRRCVDSSIAFDPFDSAVAAAALLVEAARKARAEKGFCDPLDFAAAAALIAGNAWLPAAVR